MKAWNNRQRTERRERMKAEKPHLRDDFGNAPEIIAEKDIHIKQLEDSLELAKNQIAELKVLLSSEHNISDNLRDEIAELKEALNFNEKARDIDFAEITKLKSEIKALESKEGYEIGLEHGKGLLKEKIQKLKVRESRTDKGGHERNQKSRENQRR